MNTTTFYHLASLTCFALTLLFSTILALQPDDSWLLEACGFFFMGFFYRNKALEKGEKHFCLPKEKAVILAFTFIMLTAFLPNAHARTTTSLDYYMTSNICTVNGVTGYNLNATQTSSPILVNASAGPGSVTVQWGVRVWHVDSINATTELTSATQAAIVSRTPGVNGSGIQSATWTPATTPLTVGFDSLKVIVYYRFVAAAWVAAATFTTDRLHEASLLNETITFYYWTNRTETPTPTTYMEFRFGSSTYNSRIEDVGYAEPYPPEDMMVELANQDFWGFLMYPMNYVLGSLSYGVFLLLINVPLIKRYNSIVPTLILFILFGGAAGAFTLMIPEVGLSIGWIFMVIGLGGLLWKWTR